MRLFHCHRILESKNVESLLAILSASPSCLVLREKAIQSINLVSLIESINETTSIHLLTDQNSDKIPEELLPYTINNQQFVELCAQANQIIAWK